MFQVFNPFDYAGRFPFISGWLCLEFTNTTNYARSPSEDLIVSFTDLLGWGCMAGLITPESGARLAGQALRAPAQALDTLAEARVLRLALHQIFTATIQGRAPEPIALATLNSAMRQTTPHISVRHTPQRFDFGVSRGGVDAREILSPVVWSAVSLLISRSLPRVRRCQGADCSRLFINETRSRNRRWCSMKECGNRAKARRHYARRKNR